MASFSASTKLASRCSGCCFCEEYILCPGSEKCTGCGACVEACPNRARLLEPTKEKRKNVQVSIDDDILKVPERITVLSALELADCRISRYSSDSEIFAPCRTGGCWSCSVIVDGTLKPACITPVHEGMTIVSDRKQVNLLPPLRLVSGYQGHSVGGVGTPYCVKARGGGGRYIEVACFTHGCILRCPTCQNWEVTYSSVEKPSDPVVAARELTRLRRMCGVDRMAISGGECTLNRRWLVMFLKELRNLNPDGQARFHVDTNAVILTPDYIDELVEAGITDIGPDIKGLTLETFTRITGLIDNEMAAKLHNTEWNAVKYLLDHYYGRVFVGVGIPYNSKLVTPDEIRRMGEKIAGWEPEVQVCVLDYRPEFRRRDIRRPRYEEMVEVARVLRESGLKHVICQTERGHIMPQS